MNRLISALHSKHIVSGLICSLAATMAPSLVLACLNTR